jgi:hypothetical protein
LSTTVRSPPWLGCGEIKIETNAVTTQLCSHCLYKSFNHWLKIRRGDCLLASRDVGKTEPIKVGKASPTEGTLPASVYFICKYLNLAEAARANAEVGGDNASRSVAVGMVLGAYGGLEGIPSELGEGALVEWESTMALLDQMPLLQSRT